MAVPDVSRRLTDPLHLSHINHRPNVLGTFDLSACGLAYANCRQTGMADLVAALRWIHVNTEVFGGDPGSVTIFGQSGGGSKVVHLMHIPAAKGLFHKVVAQSGGWLTYRDTDVAASIKAQQMLAGATLKNLGLNGSQIEQPPPSARSLPARDSQREQRQTTRNRSASRA